MAEAGTFCINADVVRKAGANVNTTATAEAYTNVFIVDAENYINVFTTHNWTSAFSGLSSAVKNLLREAASNLAAIYAIQYDMSGFTSITEAQTMINVLWDAAERNMKALLDKERQKFMTNA